MRALLIISDSKESGIGRKLMLPSLKMFYKKEGWDVEVLDLAYDQFAGATVSDNMMKLRVNSYKNSIKLADHVHFITTTQFGGMAPDLELFFNKVLTEGFAYNGKKGLLDEHAFFYLNHTKKTFIPFNIPWLRIRLTRLNNMFSSRKIFQTNQNTMNAKERMEFMKSVKSHIKSTL